MKLINYTNFIKESNYLKGALGYCDINYYPGIKKVLHSNYILDNNNLIYEFGNSTEDKINEYMFKSDISNIFDLNRLKFTRSPIEVDTYKFNNFENRYNHYMIKGPNTDWTLGELNRVDIKLFIDKCLKELKRLNIPYDDRYCYVTIDTKQVKAGESQRDFGWHINGLQGDEVSNKKPADFQFIWSDKIPTKFCTQEFDITGLNLSKHNVFNWLGRQTLEEKCYLLEAEKIYLMNAYHVHTATKSDQDTNRNFVRVSFTNTPITSIRMSVNNDISYDYEIHKTTGAIPKHLE